MNPCLFRKAPSRLESRWVHVHLLRCGDALAIYMYNIYRNIGIYASLPPQKSTISAGVQMEGMQAMYTFCVAVMLSLVLSLVVERLEGRGSPLVPVEGWEAYDSGDEESSSSEEDEEPQSRDLEVISLYIYIYTYIYMRDGGRTTLGTRSRLRRKRMRRHTELRAAISR